MAQLTQLIYVSSAVTLFSEQTLNEMLILARNANRRHQITGLLLYKDGNFMQVIEGNKNDIEQLYNNICRDRRHTGIILLVKEAIEQREFFDWSMGFKNLSSSEVDGFSNFLSTTATDKLLPGNAKTVLLSFKHC